jgi:hypothetical protein
VVTVLALGLKGSARGFSVGEDLRLKTKGAAFGLNSEALASARELSVRRTEIAGRCTESEPA